MTDAEGPSGFFLDELIAYGERRSGWAVALMDHNVHGIVGALKELRERRAAEPREERAPMFNELAQRADGGLETRQTEKCPTCGGGYFKAELGWQHNCLWP